MRFYGDIQRIDEDERMVWGYASTEQRAMDGNVVTRAALQAALDDYMEYANVREMHQSSAVGVTREAHVDDHGLYIGAHIVDDTAWTKVKEGVYRAFSIGAKVTERDTLDRSLIHGISLREISVVDRPGDPGTKFDLYRADGFEGDDDDTTILEDDMARAAARTAAPAAAAALASASPAALAVGLAAAPQAELPAEGVERAAEGAEAAEEVVEAAPAAEVAEEAPVAEVEAPAAESEAEPDPVERAIQAADAASASLGAAVEGVERAAAGDTPALVLICGQGPAAELRRGMSTVSRLAQVLSDLAYIIAEAAWEAEYEGDSSPVPEKLRDGLKTLAAAFKSMSEEEVNELLASVSATAGVDSAVIMFAASGADLERAADVAFTEEQSAQIQTALEGFIARGFAPVLPAVDENDLQRQVSDLTAGRDKLLGSVETLTGQMTELTERVSRFADAPADPKTGGALARAVDKGEDAAGPANEAVAADPTTEEIQRVLAGMNPEERGLLLTRAALSRPLPVTR